MKKIFFVLLLLFMSINLQAQKTDTIIGKWIFTKALNKDIDETGLESLRTEVIGKWKFEFKSDGNFYTNMMGEKVNGLWRLAPNSKTLVLTNVEGGPLELIILKSSENELALKLGLGEFLLTRIK